MATNHATILESEIDEIEARIWRLKQAVEVPDPKFNFTEMDRQIMQLRLETTIRLYRIMQVQLEMWNTEREDCDRILKDYGSAERLVDSIEDEPDYSSMDERYKSELEELDTTNRFVDHKWMSITRPEDSLWKDYPDKLKKELKKEADALLKKTMKRKNYLEMKKECEADEKLDHFQRYEKRMLQVYPKSKVRKMVADEKRYYRDLAKWNKANSKKGVRK